MVCYRQQLSAHEPATFFQCECTEMREKGFFFLGKTLRTRKFSKGKFFGATESLRTQDSENVVGLNDRATLSKL